MLNISRDPENQKVAGVCAGIAKRFGWKARNVRVCALAAALMLPHIVLVAYLLAAYFLKPETDLAHWLD